LCIKGRIEGVCITDLQPTDWRWAARLDIVAVHVLLTWLTHYERS
jgi:hypothetical protein